MSVTLDMLLHTSHALLLSGSGLYLTLFIPLLNKSSLLSQLLLLIHLLLILLRSLPLHADREAKSAAKSKNPKAYAESLTLHYFLPV